MHDPALESFFEFWGGGEFAAAERELDRRFEQGELDEETYLRYATEVCLVTGRPEEAKPLLEELDADSPERRLQQAQLRMELGELDEAEEHARAAMEGAEHEKTRGIALFTLARINLLCEDFYSALELAERREELLTERWEPGAEGHVGTEAPGHFLMHAWLLMQLGRPPAEVVEKLVLSQTEPPCYCDQWHTARVRREVARWLWRKLPGLQINLGELEPPERSSYRKSGLEMDRRLSDFRHWWKHGEFTVAREELDALGKDELGADLFFTLRADTFLAQEQPEQAMEEIEALRRHGGYRPLHRALAHFALGELEDCRGLLLDRSKSEYAAGKPGERLLYLAALVYLEREELKRAESRMRSAEVRLMHRWQPLADSPQDSSAVESFYSAYACLLHRRNRKLDYILQRWLMGMLAPEHRPRKFLAVPYQVRNSRWLARRMDRVKQVARSNA